MRNKPVEKVEYFDKTKKLPNYGLTDSEYLTEMSAGIIPAQTGYVGHGQDDFINFLIDLADEQDLEGNIKEANFLDNLIKISAETNHVNYFNKLRRLLNKKYSEGTELKEFGLNLYSQYSSVLNETGNTQTAARIAYLNLSEEGVEKTAATLEQDPIYVANSIVNIIKIMVSMISHEKRRGAFESISNKILEDFNAPEISQKRAPGGAAIGTSLALIKNILNSRDELFIRIVLDEVRKKLGY